jgi:hypothetical protein
MLCFNIQLRNSLFHRSNPGYIDHTQPWSNCSVIERESYPWTAVLQTHNRVKLRIVNQKPNFPLGNSHMDWFDPDYVKGACPVK